MQRHVAYFCRRGAYSLRRAARPFFSALCVDSNFQAVGLAVCVCFEGKFLAGYGGILFAFYFQIILGQYSVIFVFRVLNDDLIYVMPRVVGIIVY